MSKEQERDNLHRTIWQIANDLHGSVDGWDFKSYVLGMLFYRFISENLTSHLNREERRTGNTEFDFSKISDVDDDHFACLIPNSDIAENDYNIAVRSYVEQKNTIEEVDIVKLNAEIAEIVFRQQQLRNVIDKIVTNKEGGSL